MNKVLIISIITEKGLEFFEKKDINKIEDIIKNKKTLIQTIEDREHLGIFYNFNVNSKSFYLKSIDKDYREISISIDKIKDLFQIIDL